MFTKFAESQYAAYKEAFDFFKCNPQRLIEAERFVMNEIIHFIDIHQPEIKRDYDEASYLYSFWKNYPPLDRGRAPKGDQYPWIEVGEQVFGNKLQRHFNANFSVKDSGLPSGADDRCIISTNRKYIGIELMEHYADLARRRVEAVLRTPKLAFA